MSYIPKFRIYASNGSTLKYTLTMVQDANYPHSEKDLIEHTNQRAKGSILIDGGDKAWDLSIRFVISGIDYEGLISKIDEIETNIPQNIPLVLKIDKTSNTAYTYKVKRISPIEYPIGDDFRVNYQEITMTLRVNAW